VLKLFAKPSAMATALVAVPDPSAAVALLGHLRDACGERLTGFELMSRVCVDLSLKHVPGIQDPLPQRHPWYVLVELSDAGEAAALRERLEEGLASAMEAGLAADAVIASSDAQRLALWRLRESFAEAQKADGPSIKHDVSVPVSRVPELIERGGRELAARFPGIRVLAFGHLGDGNIHYNCSKSERLQAEAFFAESPAVNRVVYDLVAALGGSISAEHGLGVLKREENARYKSALEIELMRSVKRALDPHGIMNPGKVL
jgi:FAD/FMN-containing dehydrogenase